MHCYLLLPFCSAGLGWSRYLDSFLLSLERTITTRSGDSYIRNELGFGLVKFSIKSEDLDIEFGDNFSIICSCDSLI